MRTDSSDSVHVRQQLSDADPDVRIEAIRALARIAPNDLDARRAIASVTHDPVDKVAFAAIAVCGSLKIVEAVRELIGIVGWPSNFTRPTTTRKPVGIGAALTKRALLDILGSEDPEELRKREDEVFAAEIARVGDRRAPHLEDAVYVPGGMFIAGSQPRTDRDETYRMDASDNPLRVEQEDGFWIDRTAVSNRRYERFLVDVGGSKEFAHPDEPEGKDYKPAHWQDPRFSDPTKPVVGCDWYDAYAFATWAGGRLPSENQWEKAARGTDGRLYPWGNSWDPSRANYIGRTAGRVPVDLAELEAVLIGFAAAPPGEPLVDVDAFPDGASPYGLLQMSGNVWEMTRTNYFTRLDMVPFFRRYAPSEITNRPEAFYVIRGGTWTSPEVCLRTDFRGKDLLTDRHFEIGFRCVYEALEPSA